MTRYERIKIMTIEEMAHLISVAWNHTDYEDDDWDPGIMEWLRSEAEETARMRWIPVAERLPEKNDAGKDGHVMAWRLGCAMSIAYQDVRPENATHWMPLPEAPKEATEAEKEREKNDKSTEA